MSSSSSSSEFSVQSATDRSVDALARKILKRLTGTPPHQPLAVADHRRATELMLRARDAFTAGMTCEHSALMAFTCAGVALQRRICLSVDALHAGDSLTTTMALLFVLVVLASAPKPPDVATGSDDAAMEETAETAETEADDDRVCIATWQNQSVEAALRAANDDTSSSSWGEVLRSSGGLAKILLQDAQKRGSKMTLEQVAEHATLFFRASAQAIQTSIIDGAGVVCDSNAFLTLDTLNFVALANDATDEKLQSVSDCAESEVGQQVLRDLILSFKLPRFVVGVRRTCLLSRQANKVATEKYSEILTGGHEAAMRGARWTYDNDADEIHKICALLAGIAVMQCRDAQSVRKDDIFGGRVSLPFLETFPPEPGTTRLALLESTDEWVVYTVDAKSKPTVKLRQRGFDGLKQSMLVFSRTVQT